MALRKRRVLRIVTAVAGLLLLLCWAVSWTLDRMAGNTAIHCYGRVVDQNGAGVPGVRVSAKITAVRWLSNPFFPRQRYRTLTAVTDEEGRFAFEGVSGKFLDLGPFEKSGWRPDIAAFRKTQLGFEYPLLGYEYPPGQRKKPDNPTDPISYVMRRND